MDTTIDEMRAGWEQVREKVKALQLTAQFYAERNQQLIDENRELQRLQYNQSMLLAKIKRLDDLLWWATAIVEREADRNIFIGVVNMWKQLRLMLATQDYTRESLEKR